MFIIVLLLCMKFLLYPVLEWQDAQIINLQLLKNKYLKTTELNKQKDTIEKYYQDISMKLQGVKGVVFEPMKETELQLQQQKWLEGLLAKNFISYRNIGWEKPTLVDGNNDIIKHSVNLSLKGDINDIVSLYISLETNIHFTSIDSFNFNIKGNDQTKLDGRLVLSFYSYGHNS